jgi:hypothetical protein
MRFNLFHDRFWLHWFLRNFGFVSAWHVRDVRAWFSPTNSMFTSFVRTCIGRGTGALIVPCYSFQLQSTGCVHRELNFAPVQDM